MANKELTEADIEQMEETARDFRMRQQAARDRANAQGALAERDAVKPLLDFVASDQYKGFIRDASAVASGLTGQPLIQHLVGALTSLSVVTADVTNAQARYEAADSLLKPEAPPAPPAPPAQPSE